MIDQQTVERILATAQIVDVVSDFITLRRRGVNWVGLCPFHEDKTPSFYVSPAKNICKCFACGEGGTPVHFIRKHEKITYPEALKYLAKKYNIEVREIEMSDEQRQAQNDREAMFILNSFAQKTFTDNLFLTEEGQTIGLPYFRERGFREDIIRKFQLGYALEARDAFTQAALKAGYRREFLEKTGLSIAGSNYLIDRFRGRVIFPVQTLSGKVVAFGGRILLSAKTDKLAKYINSPESDIYHKSNELYGIYLARQAIVKKDHCFLVEGYTDVISMHQAGIENVVAASGTALPHEQIRLIMRFTKNITVLRDSDAAGIKAAIDDVDKLLDAGMSVKIVLLPEGDDPDSFARSHSATEFNAYIQEHETDFVNFKAGLLLKEAGNDPVKRGQVIMKIVATIALISEEILRAVYAKECSKMFDMDEGILLREIAKKRRELLLQKKKTLYPDPENPEIPQAPLPLPPEVELPPVEQAAPLLYDKYERGILYYLIRYGEQMIRYTDQEKQTHEKTLIQFIADDLQQQNNIAFQNPVYRQILKEGLAHYADANFVATTFFCNHPQPEISRIASELSSDPYIESQIYTKGIPQEQDEAKRRQNELDKLQKNLLEKVPYALCNYRYAILKQEIKNINQQMKAATESADIDKQLALIKQLNEKKTIQKQYAQHLRERIVAKI
ncbi:MAG: DNA primase [Candidatus Symbiothrix sp.]|jgi:DNA primase|nr:DNA primase [Candidatus Symbiothrix sp.]